MTARIPRSWRLLADVLFWAGLLAFLSVPVGLGLAAFVLPQPETHEREDTWDTGERDLLAVSNLVRVTTNATRTEGP